MEEKTLGNFSSQDLQIHSHNNQWENVQPNQQKENSVCRVDACESGNRGSDVLMPINFAQQTFLPQEIGALNALHASKVRSLIQSNSKLQKEIIQLKAMQKDNVRVKMIKALRQQLREQMAISDALQKMAFDKGIDTEAIENVYVDTLSKLKLRVDGNPATLHKKLLNANAEIDRLREIVGKYKRSRFLGDPEVATSLSSADNCEHHSGRTDTLVDDRKTQHQLLREVNILRKQAEHSQAEIAAKDNSLEQLQEMLNSYMADNRNYREFKSKFKESETSRRQLERELQELKNWRANNITNSKIAHQQVKQLQLELQACKQLQQQSGKQASLRNRRLQKLSDLHLRERQALENEVSHMRTVLASLQLCASTDMKKQVIYDLQQRLFHTKDQLAAAEAELKSKLADAEDLTSDNDRVLYHDIDLKIVQSDEPQSKQLESQDALMQVQNHATNVEHEKQQHEDFEELLNIRDAKIEHLTRIIDELESNFQDNKLQLNASYEQIHKLESFLQRVQADKNTVTKYSQSLAHQLETIKEERAKDRAQIESSQLRASATLLKAFEERENDLLEDIDILKDQIERLKVRAGLKHPDHLHDDAENDSNISDIENDDLDDHIGNNNLDSDIKKDNPHPDIEQSFLPSDTDAFSR